jgi:prepilin-type N-terminal cleavage/methylation domain-containing protein
MTAFMTAPDTRAPISRNGFTLLEILLALSILATVLSTVFASYTGTFRVVSETESQAETYEMARIAFERILEDFESSYPPPEQSETSEADEEEALELTGDLPLSIFSRAHVVFTEEDRSRASTKITYDVGKGDEGQGWILYRRETPWGVDEASEEGEKRQPLCEKLFSDDTPFTFISYNAAGEEMDNEDASSKGQTTSRVDVDLRFINPSAPETPLKFSTSVYRRVVRVEEGDLNAED